MPKRKADKYQEVVTAIARFSAAAKKPAKKKAAGHKPKKQKPSPWGSDKQEKELFDLVLELRSKSHKDQTAGEKHLLKQASEQIGDAGGVFTLQSALADANVEYDDKCYFPGSGSNVFDAAYIHPNCQNPQFAVVVEHKGGKSQLGTRALTDSTGNSYVDTNGATVSKATDAARVKQGTEEYLKEEIKTLKALPNKSDTSDPSWPVIGQAIETLISASSSNVIYMTVRTPHDATGVGQPKVETVKTI